MKPMRKPVTPLSDHRRESELESWLCDRLALRDLFSGVTDKQTRAARLKVTLMQRNSVDSILGTFDGKPRTGLWAYETLYGDWRDEA